MATDFTVKKPKDLTKINSNDLGELLWWSYHFGTSPEKILTLVEQFGNSAEEIKKSFIP
jgi:uncharacterized protein DUF3606